MSITLDTPKASTPTVRLRNIGDGIAVAVVNSQIVPWRDFATGEPKIGDNGKPRTQDMLTGIVVAVHGAVVGGPDGDDVAPEVGDTVRVFLAGHRRWSWIEAKREHGNLTVGDIARFKYDKDEPSDRRGNQPRKVWAIKVEPNPDQGSVAACEQAYRDATATVIDQAGDSSDDDWNF